MVWEVYFDDFRVQHIKSPVVSSQDYYSFGLQFNNYQRENSLNNQYKYNGKEMQDELDLAWLDYGARMYMSDLGRWGVVDPLAETMVDYAPYVYAFNDPINLLIYLAFLPMSFRIQMKEEVALKSGIEMPKTTGTSTTSPRVRLALRAKVMISIETAVRNSRTKRVLEYTMTTSMVWALLRRMFA